MKKTIKFELNFSVEELLTSATKRGVVLVNPLTGNIPVMEDVYMVDIITREIRGTELDVVNFVVNNWETFTKTGWYLALYCNANGEYHIGLMYVTGCIMKAVDTAHHVGCDHFISSNNEYIKSYCFDDCFTLTQELVIRKRWIDDYKKYQIIEL